MYPVRSAMRTAKKVVETVYEMKAQVNTATTNHLHTIEKNTGDAVEILREMQLEQRELNGYLKGQASR